MVERSASLFQITDTRKVIQNHVTSQVFEEKPEASRWLKNLAAMFPKEEFEEIVKIFESDDAEVTAFKVQVEYRRKTEVSEDVQGIPDEVS